jgi:hypothetical protein
MLSSTVPAPNRLLIGLCALMSAVGCTGLTAGPEASAVTPMPVSRDTAWVRARRAAQAEAVTVDLADSLRGQIIGTRFSDPKAQVGSAASCRVRLTLQIEGDESKSEIATTSRWLAPVQAGDKGPKVCEQERTDVLARINQTIVPPAP